MLAQERALWFTVGPAMTTALVPSSTPSPVRASARKPIVPSAMLGVLIGVAAEVMFFSGLISAYVISRSSAGPTLWPPPGQPRLPVETTALNTLALLASAVVLFFATRAARRGGKSAAQLLGAAMALGSFFIVAQGREWVALIRQGLTLTTSTHGSFFYVIVGCHGVHALGALLALGWAFAKLRQGRLENDTFTAVSLFWYFVAGVWPVLYYQVYLT